MVTKSRYFSMTFAMKPTKWKLTENNDKTKENENDNEFNDKTIFYTDDNWDLHIVNFLLNFDNKTQ